jgi:CHAD domain-containing protein
MAYRFKPGRPIDNEVRRLVDNQFELALATMRGVGSRQRDKATHHARRHIKKVRALMRLVRPSLGDWYGPANRRLRAASRLLAPIADGEAIVDTLGRLRRKFRGELPPQTFKAIRTALIQRETRTDRRVTSGRILRAVARSMSAVQRRARLWVFKPNGVRAVVPGLLRSLRRSRRAMASAQECPTGEHYHQWRQRVKDLWLQVRLIEPCVGDQLADYERLLERLDGCLGEYHNCTLLMNVLVREGLVTRLQTAHCLRLLRKYQGELRREARTLGSEVDRDPPRELVRRVKQLWLDGSVAARVDETTSWPRAA